MIGWLALLLPTDTLPRLADSTTLVPFVDGVMSSHLERYRIPAAVVAIVEGDRVVLARGYGQADRERGTPVDPATSMFHIGSTGKLFTWTAVMQLVEQGKLDLDEDLNRYLGDFQIPATFAEPITLRHLLTHTAGFEDGALGYFLTLDSTNISTIEEVVTEHVPSRVRRPGILGSYSNYGAALAGLIVERVSGVPFAEYVERNIYAPLGIRYATFREPLPPALEPHGVTGYAQENGVFVAKPYEINGGWTPAGGTSISALDMARFMIAHLNEGQYVGGRILEPETVRLMQTTAFRHDPRMPGIALGFYEQRLSDPRVIGHGGDSFWFHTELHLIPQQRVGIFISYVGDGGAEAAPAFSRALFDRYFPRPEPLGSSRPGSAPADLAKFARTYRFLRMNYTDIDKLVWLLQPPIRVSASDNGTLKVSGPLNRDGATYSAVDSNLFQEVGGFSRIAFREEAGRITRIFFDTVPYQATERIPWHERADLWYGALAVAFLLSLTAFLRPLVFRGELRAMASGPRRAIWLSAMTAGWLVLTILGSFAVVAMYGSTLLGQIPFGLKAALALPVGFVVLSVALAVTTFGVWKRRYWSTGWRLHFTLVTVGAVVICLFFVHWNILGWQFG